MTKLFKVYDKLTGDFLFTSTTPINDTEHYSEEIIAPKATKNY